MTIYCNCSSYSMMFNDKNALRDLRHYRKKGLKKETRILFDLLKNRVRRKTLTEIGSGIGLLAMELTIAGVKKYYGTEISNPSIEMARELVDKPKFKNKIEFSGEDWIEKPEKFNKSDIVLSDKVVCCYPYMEKFINATASKAKKYYAITYPKETIPSKIIVEVIAFLIKCSPMKGFRPYIHDTKKINEIIGSYGFRKISHAKTFIWEVLVFKKQKEF